MVKFVTISWKTALSFELILDDITLVANGRNEFITLIVLEVVVTGMVFNCVRTVVFVTNLI